MSKNKNPKKDQDPEAMAVNGSDKALAEALASIENMESGKDPKPAHESVKIPTNPMDQLSSLMKKKDERLKEAHDRVLRLSADFDNFKKRARKEQDQAIDRGIDQFLLDFLPIMDSFERTLEHGTLTPETKVMMEGIGLIHKQILHFFEKLGIQTVESLGKAFDPNFHEAMAQQDTNQHPHGQILSEMERGYTRKGRLLRPSRVVVANNPENTDKLSENKDEDSDKNPSDFTPMKC
jgi:molecular chaperone GrpE